MSLTRTVQKRFLNQSTGRIAGFVPDVGIAESAAALVVVDILRVVMAVGHARLAFLLHGILVGLLTALLVSWRYPGLESADFGGFSVVGLNRFGYRAYVRVCLVGVRVCVLVLRVCF